VLITSIILYFFVKHEGRYRENYTWSFLIMFSLSTSQYAHYNPIKVSIKIFLASFFFFGLHISTAYHSYLINVLTNPRYSKQIDAVDDAIVFNLTFKAAENARDFFMKNDSVRDLSLIPNIARLTFAFRFSRRNICCAITSCVRSSTTASWM
jgi:hypothetical protein